MTRRRLRAWAEVLTAGIVIAVGCVSTDVASAAPDHEGRYIALGDSVPFGFSPLLEDPWIVERFVGYPEVIAQRTELRVTNLACPGQTAQALISRTAIDNGCFEGRKFARRNGFMFLHTDYPGTQLRAALAVVRSGPSPALISIQAGGNELVLCVFGPNPGPCLADALPKVSESLRQVVVQLRDAGYRGNVILVGYHLVPGLEAQAARLNKTIERTARRMDVTFLDSAALFDRYARPHNGDLCAAGLLVALPDESCDPFHPSRAGHRLLATAVLDVTSLR